MNMQDFYTGHAFDAYEFFGAHTYFGGTHFAVWAPSAQHIAVETEVGTEYEVNLTEYFARCDAGQAALTRKQADAIREIVQRLGE